MLGAGRSIRSGPSGGKRVLSPARYMIKDLWRNRSRVVLSTSGMVALVFTMVLFSSLQNGLEDYLSGKEGVPDREEIELEQVGAAMDRWILVIVPLCAILLALVVANTSMINVMERRFELATLRALGLSTSQVFALVTGAMGAQLMIGVAFGSVLGMVATLMLDGVPLSIAGGGLGLPMSFDRDMFVILLLITAVSAVVGMMFPLFMITRARPQEVLRNA